MLVGTLTGCGARQYKVTGTISYNGEAVESGEVILHDAEGQVAPSGGPIKAGQFELLAFPGKKRVQVFATRKIHLHDGPMGSYGESIIPADYSAKLDLKAEVVPSDEANTLVFDLKGPKVTAPKR